MKISRFSDAQIMRILAQAENGAPVTVDLPRFNSASLNGIITIKEILLWLINTTKNLNARRYALR